MAEEIAFDNGWISNFEGLVTLTLDQVILHTVMHRSSTSTRTPNFIEIEESFCGRTENTHARTYGQTFETGFIRWNLLKSRPKNVTIQFDSEENTTHQCHYPCSQAMLLGLRPCPEQTECFPAAEY